MKKVIYSVVALLLFSLHANAQDISIPETQQSLITKRTADWCGNCGSWGWTMFKNLLADNNEKAVVVASHSSGGLLNATSSAWISNLGGAGQPRFFLNDSDQGVSSGTIAAKRTSIKEAVDNMAAMNPVVQAGIVAGMNDSEFVVQAQAQFFQDAEGTYSMGIFLIQKEFVSFQSNQGSNAVHEQLLTAHLTDDVLGDPLATGSIVAGTITDLVEYRLPIGDYDADNVEFAVVIWKEDGNSRSFVNGNTTDDILPVNANEVSWPNAEVQLFPNVTNGLVQMELALPNTIMVKAELLDGNGRFVRSLFTESVLAGNTRYELNLADLAAGQYFVHLESVEGRLVEKVIVVR